MLEYTMTQPPVTMMDGNVTKECKSIVPYDKDRIPLLVLYCAVLIVGVPANLVTLYLTLLQVRRSNVLAVYLLSLSLCDFTYLLTLPAWAVYISDGHKWPWSSLACKFTGYIFFTNMYISIFLLCCISLDRYVAVVYAMESRAHRQQRVAVVVSILIWIIVGVVHSPVFMMHEESVTKELHCFEPGQSTATVTGYNYARFCIGFLGPLIVLIFTNRTILTNVHASAGLQSHQKKKVRILAIAVVTLFLVCFGPYHIILLTRAITHHFPNLLKMCHLELHSYTPYTISLGLSTVNSAINPVLYVLSSDNIRKEIRSCMRGLRRQTKIHQCCTESGQHTSNSSRNSSDMNPKDQDDTKTLTMIVSHKNKH